MVGRKQIATLGTSGALEPVPFPEAHSAIPLGPLEIRISVSIYTLDTGKWCEQGLEGGGFCVVVPHFNLYNLV